MHETIKVPIEYSFQSLVGISVNEKTKYPLSFGNYFDLVIKPDDEVVIVEEEIQSYELTILLKYSCKVLNMWIENLREAQKRFLPDNCVEIRKYAKHCLIVDERIPKEWLYNKLCFTGRKSPTLDEVKDMYAFVGDPDNELEQFTNPKKYYENRGWKYLEFKGGGFGTISSKMVNSQPKALNMNVTTEE